MRISEIERFFRELDRRLSFPVRITLTGGAAAILFGVRRATQDIDFEVEIRAKPKRAANWSALQTALEDVEKATGITPQYSDDIDRWSSIAMPAKRSTLWKKLGKVEVRIFDPSSWSIGKLSRYLGTDESDLVEVLSVMGKDAASLVKFWGKSLGGSPPSSDQPLFKRNVERFLRENGNRVWGKKINSNQLVELFLKTARATTRV